MNTNNETNWLGDINSNLHAHITHAICEFYFVLENSSKFVTSGMILAVFCHNMKKGTHQYKAVECNYKNVAT